jgi:hypothetical protein
MTESTGYMSRDTEKVEELYTHIEKQMHRKMPTVRDIAAQFVSDESVVGMEEDAYSVGRYGDYDIHVVVLLKALNDLQLRTNAVYERLAEVRYLLGTASDEREVNEAYALCDMTRPSDDGWRRLCE